MKLKECQVMENVHNAQLCGIYCFHFKNCQCNGFYYNIEESKCTIGTLFSNSNDIDPQEVNLQFDINYINMEILCK